MTDIDMVENAHLEGNALFERFIVKFEEEFMAPMQRRLMMLNWATITPEEHELLRQEAPEEYAVVEKQMKELEKRYAKS
jgi:hypothetical protein